MAVRSIGSLTVAFGLVSIPAKVYAATENMRVAFNLIDRESGSRIKQRYVSETTGKEVARADMLKGYEYAKGQYVTFEAEELKALEEENSHMAEIVEFVPASSIDPVFFDKTYYLAPAPGGAKPYALLVQAMKDTRKVAIGKWANRGKGYIVMLRAAGDGLMMQTLLYADEVRSMGDLEIPAAELKPSELALAKKLIEQDSKENFDPTSYRDEVRARVEEAIQKKINGEEVKIVAPAKAKGEVVDLMGALEASLSKSSGGEKKKAVKVVKAKKAA